MPRVLQVFIGQPIRQQATVLVEVPDDFNVAKDGDILANTVYAEEGTVFDAEWEDDIAWGVEKSDSNETGDEEVEDDPPVLRAEKTENGRIEIKKVTTR